MTDEVVEVISFDGQHVWLNRSTALYEVGNFLGGGAAGTVYEAEHVRTKEHFALKILTPLGYKLLSPALLRRCTVISKGKPVSDSVEQGNEPFHKEYVWWLLNGSTKQYLAAYHSEKTGTLRELSLRHCMSLWGPHPEGVSDTEDGRVEVLQTAAGARIYLPSVPPKYVDFVRRRSRIFREIDNMRKISHHRNVIRLENVLELTQESKCTIFLVMELANGGELFDRIKIDCGAREETAVLFFKQLLDGVQHCHSMGVCHRDLKPENLLLQDAPGSPTILKIADFGFSAWVAMAIGDDNWDGSAPHRPEVQQQVYAAGTPTFGSVLESSMGPLTNSSPLRVLNSVVGSPFYVAPEVLQARGYDGYKADVWSLGVILYAILAGNLPFSQDLVSCKRFRAFCRWVREASDQGVKFYENTSIDYPEWLFHSKFSNDSKSLIVSMLHPDPAERISVLEAMNHPWCLRGIKRAAAVTTQQMVPFFSHNSNSPSAAPGGGNSQPTNVTSPVISADRVIEAPVHVEMIADSSNSMEVIEDGTAHDLAASDEEEAMRLDEDDEQIFQMDDTEGGRPDKPITARIIPTASSGSSTAPSRRLPQELFVERPVGGYSPPPGSEQRAREAEGSLRLLHSAPIGVPTSKPASGYPQAAAMFQRTTAPVPVKTVATDDAVYKPRVSSPMLSRSAPVNWDSPLLPPQFTLDKLISGAKPADFFTEIGCEEPVESPVTPTFAKLSARAPSFHDNVKKSTRFVTSVAANEVFEKIEHILKQCKDGHMVCPVGPVRKIEISWESYRLEVWGADPSVPAFCSIQIYSLNTSSSAALGFASPSPTGSAEGSATALGPSIAPSPKSGATCGGQYLVEFVRGSIEIFAFKRFYDWLRQHVAELVKRDYGVSSLDFGSPARPSYFPQVFGDYERNQN